MKYNNILKEIGKMNSNVEEMEDYKKKREQFSENIRRANREEMFSKRRNLSSETINNDDLQTNSIKLKTLIVDQKLKPQIFQFINMEYTESMLPELIRLAASNDVLEKHRGIIGIRKIVSTQVQSPIQQIIDAGLVSQCINLARQNEFPQLKLESTWVLTNIASGTQEQTKIMIQKGCIDLMVQLLNENQYGIVDQSIWALGNIAADSTKYRDKILLLGAMDPLIKIISTTENKYLIRNGAWTITNLVRGYPTPKYDLIKPALPLIAKIVRTGLISDKQVLSDCIWALSYLTEGAKSRVQRLLETGVLPVIFEYVKDQYSGLSIPSLRIIGNFSTGNEMQTQELINNNFFKLSMQLLDHPKRAIRRETCWILSNIAAGTTSQVDAFLNEHDLLEKLLNKFLVDLIEVKREICWIFSNFSHLGNNSKILQLYLECNIINYYENLLMEEDEKTLENVLECLFKVLGVGEKAKVNEENMILKQVFSSSIVNSLQKLQEHKSPKVYKTIVKIINKYFETENPLI